MPYIPPYIAGPQSGSITPWYNVVADYGADSTGTNDCTTAFNNAISDANSSGYSIYIPPGTYKLNSALSAITKSGVIIRGDGNWNTRLLVNFASGDVITIQGNNCGVQCLSIEGIVFRTSGYDVIVDGGNNCTIRDIFSAYSCNFLWVKSATNTKVEDIYIRYLSGTIGVYYSGTSTKPSYQCQIKHMVADNPYTIGVFNSNLKTWATSTAYSLGDVFKVNGWVFQVIQAGTSGTSSPVAPSSTNWGTSEITNGTMKVRPIHNQSLTWLIMDDYSNEMVILNSALIDGSVAIRMQSTATGADIYIPGKIIPTGLRCINLEIDHPYDAGIDLQRGYGCHVTMAWIGSIYIGNGFQSDASFAGEIIIENSRITACGQHGVLINGGPDFKINNNFIFHNAINSLQSGLPAYFAPGTFHDIVLPESANTRGFTIVGNSLGFQKNVGQNNLTGYGLFVNGTSGNNFIVTGNMDRGHVSGSYTFGPTLNERKISSNNATN